MEKKSRNSFPNIIFYAFQALLQCSRGNQEKKKKKEKGLGDDDDDKAWLFSERLEPGSKPGIEPYLQSKKPKIAPLI